MNDVQPPTLYDPVRTRKATIGISVGIGDARVLDSLDVEVAGEKKLVTK